MRKEWAGLLPAPTAATVLDLAMISPFLSELEQSTVGRICRVQRRETDWAFSFGDGVANGCVLTAETFWRIVDGERIALTSLDDGQQFGLPAPIDAEEKCRALLRDRPVLAITVAPKTADVIITFERDARLEIVTSSCGYESWQAYFRDADRDLTLIGSGGELSIVSAPIGSKATVVVEGPLSTS